MSAEDILKQITSVDEHGFEIKPNLWWLPESVEDELKRLEMNQAFYQEFIKGGYRFPREINQARTDEYHRIRELKGLDRAA